MPDFTPCCPGLESSLHFESSDRRALFRKRSVPSLRASLHFGPVYRAMVLFRQIKWWSDTPALRRPAAVMRHRGHIRNAGDLEPERIQGAHRRLAAGPRSLDLHLEVLDPALLRRLARRLGGNLRGERGRLARALETGAARSRPGQCVSLTIGDGDDRVVERRVDMRNAFGDVLLDLLARPRDGLGRCLCHSLVPYVLNP